MERSRLALWSRRLARSAITQVRYVLAQHDELVDLVVAGNDGLGRMTEFFERTTHPGNRMVELDLA